jgi:hypothetical protein
VIDIARTIEGAHLKYLVDSFVDVDVLADSEINAVEAVAAQRVAPDAAKS